jgi:hypothetical protein
MASEKKSRVLVRQPTLTHDNPIPGKRITFMISAHGTELLDYVIDKEGVNVRIFSLAGELGVCSVRGSESFNRDEYFEYVKKELAKTTSDTSTYQVIKILQNAKREEYKRDVRKNIESLKKRYEKAQIDLANLKTTLEREGRHIIKDDDDEWIENKEIHEQRQFLLKMESILEEIKRALKSTQKEQHIRTYEPVINKFYNFREEIEYKEGEEEGHLASRFIKVVHYDGDAEDKQYESLDLKDSDQVNSLFSDGKDEELLKKYKTQNESNVISLDIIIDIAKKMGFTIINIIDLSCRITSGDDSYIPEIKAVEKETAISSLAGGKKRKTRKPINIKKKRGNSKRSCRRTYKKNKSI